MSIPKQQIHAELLALREAGSTNNELVMAACTKLFAAGLKPNQSNVLEAVRIEGSSPSAQTVIKGLDAFWDYAREKVASPTQQSVPEPILAAMKTLSMLAEKAEAEKERLFLKCGELDEVAKAQASEIERLKRELRSSRAKRHN